MWSLAPWPRVHKTVEMAETASQTLRDELTNLAAGWCVLSERRLRGLFLKPRHNLFATLVISQTLLSNQLSIVNVATSQHDDVSMSVVKAHQDRTPDFQMLLPTWKPKSYPVQGCLEGRLEFQGTGSGGWEVRRNHLVRSTTR